MANIGPVSVQPLSCHYCFTFPATKKCGACKLIHYCSEKCQKNAWKAHKLVCGKQSLLETFKEPHALHKLPLALCFAAHNVWNHTPHSVREVLYNEKMPTKNGLWSPKEVETLAIPQTPASTVWFEDLDGSRRMLSKEEYFQKFGTHFIEGVHIFGKDAIDFLSHVQNIGGLINLNVNNPNEFLAIQKLRRNPPKLRVRMESPEECPEMGYGLCSDSVIKKGTLVLNVEGQLASKIPNSRKSYLDSFRCGAFGDIQMFLDQQYFTGYGRTINDGPPNCAPVRLIDNPQRAEELYTFIAIRDIQKDEFIHIYYSTNHSLRFNHEYSLPITYRKELASFCKAHLGDIHSINELLQEFQELSLSHVHKITMLQYIFLTPKVLISLILNKELDGRAALYLLSTPTLDKYIELSHTTKNDLVTVINNLMEILPDQELVNCFLKRTNKLCQPALWSMIKEISQFPLTMHSLPFFLKKAKIFQEVVHFMNLRYMYKEPEEEGKEEPLDFENLFHRYASLPSGLHNMTLPDYIQSVNKYIDLNKIDALMCFGQKCVNLMQSP